MNTMKKGGGKKNAMQVNALARPTRNRKPSLRKSAVIKDREDANAANAEKKARRNAREAKKTAKGELVKRVNNLGKLFSGASLKAKPTPNGVFANLFKGLNVKDKKNKP